MGYYLGRLAYSSRRSFVLINTGRLRMVDDIVRTVPLALTFQTVLLHVLTVKSSK